MEYFTVGIRNISIKAVNKNKTYGLKSRIQKMTVIKQKDYGFKFEALEIKP